MTLLAFILVLLFCQSAHHEARGKTLAEVGRSLLAVLTKCRLITLIVVVTGSCLVRHQLFASIPKYVLRMDGEGASSSWHTNVNQASSCSLRARRTSCCASATRCSS